MKLMLLIIFIILFSGCREETTSEGENITCTLVAIYALKIEVFDQETGSAISCGASALIQDIDYEEEVVNKSGSSCKITLSLVGALERDGTYTVTVSKEGYNEWTQSDIVVTKNICHVNPITLQAYLSKWATGLILLKVNILFDRSGNSHSTGHPL